MSQADKSRYYQALKGVGVNFSKAYREYTTEELANAYTRLVQEGVLNEDGTPVQPEATHQPDPGPEPEVPHPDDPRLDPGDDEGVPDFGDLEEFYTSPEQGVTDEGEEYGEIQDVEPPQVYAEQQRVEESLRAQHAPQPVQADQPTAGVPVRDRDPNEFAGQRQNSHADMQPLRVDDKGRTWFQEEVQKPAFPKPRGRRVLQYNDTGTKKQQVKVGDYLESFEVAGDQRRTGEIKITLPSYQVGIYADPRFPFKIHTYNGVNGFDLYDVENYFGGSDLVPEEVKRSYVANDLCYDIRSVIRFIETEYRRLQLAGGIQ